MSTIRRATPDPTSAASARSVIPQTQEASQAAGPAAVATTGVQTPADGVERLRRNTGKLTGAVESALPPPAPPPTPQLESVAAAAQAFSGNLLEMGGRFNSSEEMLLAFLKLQLLESSRGNRDTGLARWGRSQLLSGALSSVKDGDLDLAAQRRDEAQQHDQAARSQKNQGDAILREAGVDPAEVDALAQQTLNDGGTPEDVIQRYAQAHPGDPALQQKLAALREAEPHYRQAVQSAQTADSLRGVAGAMEGAWMMGSFLSNTVRAGAEGVSALLANEEAQKKLANELMAILSGQRPDASAKDEAMRTMEESRQLVAELLQEITDKIDRLKSSTLAAALRG